VKPVVNFKKDEGVKIFNNCAYLFPINHSSPFVSNTKHVITSPIVHIEYNEFNEIEKIETENTIYKAIHERQTR
jgi:hypothetical protein